MIYQKTPLPVGENSSRHWPDFRQLWQSEVLLDLNRAIRMYEKMVSIKDWFYMNHQKATDTLKNMKAISPFTFYHGSKLNVYPRRFSGSSDKVLNIAHCRVKRTWGQAQKTRFLTERGFYLEAKLALKGDFFWEFPAKKNYMIDCFHCAFAKKFQFWEGESAYHGDIFMIFLKHVVPLPEHHQPNNTTCIARHKSQAVKASNALQCLKQQGFLPEERNSIPARWIARRHWPKFYKFIDFKSACTSQKKSFLIG